MLKVDKINVFYDRTQILHDLSFDIEQGRVTALLGGNGAGKTTTIRAVSGLLRPKSGSIVFLDREISRTEISKIVKLGLVHVPQEREIFTQMTVLENLELGACVRSEGKEIKKDIAHVFSLFPILDERRNMSAGYLSGGEQQMLAIARGMMARPKLLMLDEPSAGLAPIIIAVIAKIIRLLNQQQITIVLVEQNVRLAIFLSDYLYIVSSGQIIHEEESKSVLYEDIFQKFIH